MALMKSLSLSAVTLSAAMFGTASALNAQNLFIEGDMVRGNQDGAPGPICVLTNQFKHLEKVVFRFRVLDGNGNVLGQDGLKSLVVELANGDKLPAAYYGGHPPASPTDYFWVVAWVIPAGYPSGTFAYKATATDMHGNTQIWEPFKRVTSQFQVLPGEITFKKP
jgi:hypothetical protein